jgi:hypothetical protein
VDVFTTPGSVVVDDAQFAAVCEEVSMPNDELDEMTVVPLPTDETEAEHKRIRSSNDRDQRLEREGKVSRHNRGYDEAADGLPAPEIQRVVDE